MLGSPAIDAASTCVAGAKDQRGQAAPVGPKCDIGAAELGALSDVLIQVPSASTPAIQEGHEVLGHAICALIEATIFPRTP